MKRIITILIGAALLIGVIATGRHGLPEQDREIYEMAAALEKTAELGFDGFRFTDYPSAFYDGDSDYVLTYENGELVTSKRRPVLSAIAATAYPVDGHYEVLVPTQERMQSLVGLISAGGADHGAQEQAATLWHEAFHCYQLTNFQSSVEGIVSGEFDERLITEYSDSNAEAVRLFTEQSELLEAAVNAEDIDKIRDNIVKYKELDEERRTLLPENVTRQEEYYTRIEGSACYIEALIYKMQKPQHFYEEYIGTISIYGNGSGKYYKAGMALCMILDRLDPEWKSGYDFSVPFTELIYRKLEL